MLPITAVILTYNEEINLPDCLRSLQGEVGQIIVVDSLSGDRTLEIAAAYQADCYQNAFVNYARQFNWALENTDIRHPWVLRIDADERWTREGFQELAGIIADPEVNGVYVRMKIYFMGHFLRWGGMYPNIFLRVFKPAYGKLENRWMDEHIEVSGKSAHSRIDVIEANQDRQRNLSLWTSKHNGYSSREAIDFCIQRYRLRPIETISSLGSNKVARKRWIKENLYFRIPLFLRPFFYAGYRYIIQLGFLDGVPGFIYTVLHGFWYRFLVDAKIYQIKRLARQENKSIRQVLEENFRIKI